MGVYASSTDQVLLTLLEKLRAETTRVSEPALARGIARFQRTTGVLLYGLDANEGEASIASALDADLGSLGERGLITRSENPHATITVLALPIAAALRLTKPLERLVEFVRDELKRNEELKHSRQTSA